MPGCCWSSREAHQPVPVLVPRAPERAVSLWVTLDYLGDSMMLRAGRVEIVAVDPFKLALQLRIPTRAVAFGQIMEVIGCASHQERSSRAQGEDSSVAQPSWCPHAVHPLRGPAQPGLAQVVDGTAPMSRLSRRSRATTQAARNDRFRLRTTSHGPGPGASSGFPTVSTPLGSEADAGRVASRNGCNSSVACVR